jgi:hypothetical protein
MLSRHVGKKILAVTSESTGFEGKLVAISLSPPMLHLEDTQRVTLRATIIDPIPRITSREAVEGGEVLVNLTHIHRIELVEKSSSKQKGSS